MDEKTLFDAISKEQKKKDKLEKDIKTIISSLITLFLSPLFLMWTWNYVMPYLFSLPILTYWQSFCLYFVAGYLSHVRKINTDT